MRNAQIVFETTLVAEECCACGMVFALPHTIQLRLKKSHDTFYCPAGHGQHYIGETDEERLAKEVERYKRLWKDEERYASTVVAERNAAQRSLKATKAAHTRTKNRIANGVCPCCHRSFANMQRHMQTKHPQYALEEQS
jgi:hypothetical protein